MDLDDFFDPKVAIAVAVTATVTSPSFRNIIRRGAVYGVAGAMMAADRISAMASSVAETAQNASQSTKEAAVDVVQGTNEPQPETATSRQ